MAKQAWQDWMVARFPAKGKTESPIEAMFGSALRLLLPHNNVGEFPTFDYKSQVTMGDFRVDFLFSIRSHKNEDIQIVVELDGHDFHERTKEQAAKDKARDRWFAAKNIKVLRFTGSEVWANPLACAQEVLDQCFLARWGEDRKQAGWRAFRAEMDALFADSKLPEPTGFAARFGRKDG